MDPKIQQMQRDLESFRATKQGGGSTVPAQSVPQPISQPTSTNPKIDQMRKDLEAFRAGETAGTTTTKKEEKKGSMIGNMAKSLLTAPATIAARPFQLAAEAILPGDNTEAIDKFSREKLGGLVAPVPQSGADVKKDAGRAIQTVALGTGAPIAGGAAFGLGSSLEQGNDLLSLDTAFNTATGGVVGKASALIGKPLLDVTGKVVGTITPKTLKNVASQGNAAVQKFMKDNQLLGGVAAPISNKIASGFQAVDDKITGTAKNLFQGGKGNVKSAIQKQYPGLSDENLQKRFVRIEEENFAKPTTLPQPSYKQATNIYKEAKARGHSPEKTLTSNGIRMQDITEEGKFNSIGKADEFRTQAMETSNNVLRPALREADYSFQRVALPDVKQTIISQIKSTPASKMSATEKERMIKIVEQKYADGGAEARAYANGYGLEDFHDNKIAAADRGKYKPGRDPSTDFQAKLAREESRAFKKLLEKNAPEELDIVRFNDEIQKMFEAADYLAALDTKKVPETLFQKGVDLFSKVTGASVGSGFAGGYGSIVGYHAGPVLLNSFKYLPNPIKAKYLRSIQVENPAIFNEIRQFIGESEFNRLMQLKLPAPGQTSFKETSPTLFTTKGGKTTPIKQEAVDIQATEGKNVKQPKQGKSDRKKLREMLEGFEEYRNPENIDAGPTPKKKKVDGKTLEELGLPKTFLRDLVKEDKYIQDKDLPKIDFGKKAKKNKRLKELYGELPVIR